MTISTLSYGCTYVGWSEFMTHDEWSKYIKWMFDHTEGDADMQNIPQRRAMQLGGVGVGSCFEHGPGFIFEDDTPQSLEERARVLFPQLF